MNYSKNTMICAMVVMAIACTEIQTVTEEIEVPVPVVCATECDDGDDCTEDVCNSMGECEHFLVPDCVECDEDADCMDEDPCTLGACEDGACVQRASDEVICLPECEVHADCDDGNPCTSDICADSVRRVCTHVFRPDMEIRVLEGDEAIGLSGHDNQDLLIFEMVSHGGTYVFEKITVNIGADCNEDGELFANWADGIYIEDGNSCGDPEALGQGFYDESSDGELISDVKLKNIDFGNVVAGPINLSSSSATGDGVARFYIVNPFRLESGETRLYALQADVYTSSLLRANLAISGLDISPMPNCIAFPNLLEGAIRIPID